MLDARCVDDAGGRAEALAVEARRSLVQRLVVECRGQRAFLEVSAHDRHRVDRRRGWDSQTAERRDEPAPCGVAEREVVDGCREDVRHLLRDELLGGGHPDVQRLGECADCGARLLTEGRVRLVADDEVVRATTELRPMPGEPRVRLDGDRDSRRRLRAREDGVGEAAAVALGRQVDGELGDEQPTVREDEDPEVARGLDETGRGDRLAGGGRMPEAIPPYCSGVRAGERGLVDFVLDVACIDVVVDVLLDLDRLGVRAVRRAGAVSVLLHSSLRRRDQLGEHPRERVDLVAPELGARSRSRRRLREHSLEPEHEAVAHLPAGRRLSEPGLDLRDRVIECGASRRAGRERQRGVLVRHEERLAEPGLGATRCANQVLGCVRRQRRDGLSLVHSRSTCCRAAPSEGLTLARTPASGTPRSIPQTPGELPCLVRNVCGRTRRASGRRLARTLPSRRDVA